MNKLNGYHTFFTHPTTRVQKYWPIDALAQLTSALFWKHHFGPIHLSCDHQHLHSLRIYGIDKVYDTIDTTLIERIPAVDSRYWAFSKIALAKEIASVSDHPFAIIDTDLWLKFIPSTWNPEAGLQCLHYENFDEDYTFNPYPNPSVFLPIDTTGLKWKTLPLNCAFTYLNSSQLINEWYQLAKEVIDGNKGKEGMGCAREMVFIEQRAISELAFNMGLVVDTIIPSVFQTQIPVGIPNLPNPWLPALNSSPLLINIEKCVRHIWGMKKEYDDINVRVSVVKTIFNDIDQVLGADSLNGFERLISDVRVINQF